MNIGTGVAISYILFENIHKEIHHPYWLPNKSIIRDYHMYHHLKSKHCAYSFTVPTWDIIFGTYPYEIGTPTILAYIPIPFLSFSGIIPKEALVPKVIPKELSLKELSLKSSLE
jgi:hypothetical protein